MSRRKIDLQNLQPRRIKRRQVQQNLAVAAMIAALLLSACGGSEDLPPDPKVRALFYENTQQCEADVKKQQSEYAVLQKAYQKKELTTAPKAPPLKVADCAPQMLAAQREHNRHAPVYSTLSDCQGDGLQCEFTPAGYATAGYRPVFGGTYFYPYGGTGISYTTVNYGGSQRRVYEPRTVYRSLTWGELVTPQGDALQRTSTGRVDVPEYTATTAPPRPKGHTARGTITGRSSTGFGSTFRGTGHGGK
jgi:uncharacterized protein YgiB involved in biofilm formation